MHYLIALPIWLGFIAWLVLSSRTRAEEPVEQQRGRCLPGIGWFALYGAAAACVAVVVVSTGLLDPRKSDEDAARAAWVVPTHASVQPPILIRTVASQAADPARVRVRAETVVRTTPSRKALVLRVARQGDVLTRFGAANGWIQVGGARPEGWVPESAAAPAG